MAHRRPGENERTRHDVRRGDLSAGGCITGSSGGAAIGRCKPAVASGWKPASGDRRSECRAETACWLCSRQPCPKGDAQLGHFLRDNQHSRKKKRREQRHSRIMKTATIIHRQTPKNLALPFTPETGILQPDRTGSRSGVATAAPVQKPLTFALA